MFRGFFFSGRKPRGSLPTKVFESDFLNYIFPFSKHSHPYRQFNCRSSQNGANPYLEESAATEKSSWSAKESDAASPFAPVNNRSLQRTSDRA